MINTQEYIDSGILELYALGELSREAALEVEALAGDHPAIMEALESLRETMENLAMAQAIAPPPALRAEILDRIAETDNGDVAHPPILHSASTEEDFRTWLDQLDQSLPEDFSEIHALPIDYHDGVQTAVLWIEREVVPEMHREFIEKFLILEGTCIMQIGDETYELGPGDYMNVPMHRWHEVKVTSDFPCKFILQRVAA